MSDEDHGMGHAGVDPDGKAITTKTFEAAGEAFDQDLDTSKENTKDLLEEE
ncbi:MAG: hypothetical protein BTN85_2127 [Candidatus Methanohalarchaeum thermophilum]|uniref:Uncharacterized protein n=1 Tax=Methanohalarchaeum thermophilum TaxID=1903181 RepID=A0A1Q6DSY4_METT1|nr:MAG: hypothetical protein BTN85_2127 [Candidatus Methanohalarchaeum thermophilum]